MKPELFKHSGLFDAEIDTKLPLRIAFIGLFTICDREGRFKWRPRELKLDVLPFDKCDFCDVLDALATRGFLIKYRVGTRVYGAIPSWNNHQVVNHRESKSDIPNYQSNEILDASTTRDARDDNACISCLGGREGKGREGNDALHAGCLTVFDFYLETMDKKRTQYDFSVKRQSAIRARLESWMRRGLTIDEAVVEMKKAVTAVSRIGWNMGTDKRTNGKKYNDFIDHIFKNDEEVESRLERYREQEDLLFQ
ncbi:MAG: hypothetical protein ACYCOU_20730 [Sulfobacillus sp.]